MIKLLLIILQRYNDFCTRRLYLGLKCFNSRQKGPLVVCETYSQHAYLHLSGCFYQGFRTGDDGGSGGAYVVDDEDMFALKLRDGVLALPVMIGCCGFKNLAHVFLSFLPVLVGLAFAKLFPSYGILDDGQMGELLDAFGDEKALVIAAFFFSFSGERDGDDGVYSVEELNA